MSTSKVYSVFSELCHARNKSKFYSHQSTAASISRRIFCSASFAAHLLLFRCSVAWFFSVSIRYLGLSEFPGTNKVKQSFNRMSLRQNLPFSHHVVFPFDELHHLSYFQSVIFRHRKQQEAPNKTRHFTSLC